MHAEYDAPSPAIAIVAVSAILPDAPDAQAFWSNVTSGRYSIADVPPGRWDPELYYDPDPKAPDKTYSKIGGWVRDYEWNPLGWKLPIPPKVADAMDEGQRWAVALTRAVFADYGKPVDGERTAVILGNAMAGEKHYATNLRITYPEIARQLGKAPAFAGLPADVRGAIADGLRETMWADYPEITEDTMPGELGNVLAGRIANLFDLHGPNFITDAACASAMAAFDAAIEGLMTGEFDAAVTGGIDRNMGASSFVKFCKIGALSATGTRPFDAGADGFVMGEGAALFLLKRLADAERDGDRIYAVLRGIGGASDGRGKGITAPNPVGQKLAVERAWKQSGLNPKDLGLLEAHGTSTRVGDVVEVTSATEVFGGADLAPGSVALGSVKSNIGHLKAAAGAAGLLKATLSLHHKVLPPSLNFVDPNPNLDWSTSPFRVNTELRDWTPAAGRVRTAGVSAFGFGGTNFHAVLEEYVPGRIDTSRRRVLATGADLGTGSAAPAASAKAPLRGVLVLGADSAPALAERLRPVAAEAAAGTAPAARAPFESDLRAPQRIAIDYADAAELADKAAKALAALDKGDNPAMWKALRARGIFRGSGPAPKVAFLYTGQGSQYANMLAGLRDEEPLVAETFAEADAVMTPLLGKPLTEYIFVPKDDEAAVAQAEASLRNTEITQPAVLATDLALTRLLEAYGVKPDLVMGHSLGEYGALVAAGALTFSSSLEAVSARGAEMAHIKTEDNGAMVAVFAPLDQVQRIVDAAEGYVVVANVNCYSQSVIGGATEAVLAAAAQCEAQGFQTFRLNVSHAFHTEIVSAASVPLRAQLQRLGVQPPSLPIVSNVTGRFYPSGPGVEEEMLDLLARQVASPVQFIDGLTSLYDAGARVFVEVGPKRALQGMAADVLGDDDVLTLFTNHPKVTDDAAFNQALAGLYASGVGTGIAEPAPVPAPAVPAPAPAAVAAPAPVHSPAAVAAAVPTPAASAPAGPVSDRTYLELGHLFADFLERSRSMLAGGGTPASTEPVVITGAALGLPGTEKVFDDDNLERLLEGQQLIDVIPSRLRQEILDKHITRLVKSDGGGRFETIDSVADVIKLAARPGEFDLAAEFGLDPERVKAYGMSTRLAIGAGIDALRDAGIPLVQRYKTTSTGSQLPDRWSLPEALRDRTGVIFASAFPGVDEFAAELTAYEEDRRKRSELAALTDVRTRVAAADPASPALAELDHRIHALEHALAEHPYTFDRRFLFRVLSMGHSQLADLIGARGPNTQINAACASTTQAIALAEDWIRAGRCTRVVVVASDDATGDDLLGWIGAGFLASGAAATDEDVTQAALPFDRRRHGMILGMGAAALVVESAEAARERGIQPICEVLGTVTANSAFHGTRLDVDHIGDVMEDVVRQAEARGVPRGQLAPETVFVSHETYTPARGGSASAEIFALRRVFGADADRIVIANTKGYTGHPMGVGIEDVVAVKSLETGLVPPVPNYREVDPELGRLNISAGGAYPVRYALRLAAGFGSQISMALLRWTPVPDGAHRAPDQLGYGYRIVDPARWQAWLAESAGHAGADLEVAQRKLRIVDRGPAARPAAPAAPATAPAPVSTPAAPAAPAPAAPTPPPAPEPVAAAGDPLEDAVLALVSEQTGYPRELLALDLDLEADLGIDTVKQAELFATVRSAYDIPRDDSLKLRDYPTLNHVIGFIRDRAPQTAAEPAGEAAAAPAAAAGPELAEGFPRRIPVPVVRPPLDWFAPTAVQIGAGTRVAVMPDEGAVSSALADLLAERGADVVVLDRDADPEAVADQLAEAHGAQPLTALFWLPALDPVDADTLDAEQRAAAISLRVKGLASAARAAYEAFEAPDRALVTATRLGGRFGYDDAGAEDVLGGAVSGFTKAFGRERGDAVVKVVDAAAGDDPLTVATRLLAEAERDPGVVEVGYADGRRWTIGLVERDVDEPAEERALGPDSVVVVTGAAGSIVSAIVADLAANGGTFHLLDLTPEPDADDPDLAAFAADRDALKLTMAQRIADRGERATPALVERELARIERSRAAWEAMAAVRAAGGEAYWHAVDLTDGEAVAEALADVAAGGRVDLLVHAAGLEISRFLPDKAQREFDLVFDVKVDGWFHLRSALAEVPVGTAVVFSSIAGRFGNGGQTDYSAANDLLCKAMSRLRNVGSPTRGVALDWTAWAEIGMASRGSIPKMMEFAGIDMLPPSIGIPVVRHESQARTGGGEVVVAGRLGILVGDRAEAGGLDPQAAAADVERTDPAGPVAGRPVAATTRGLTVAVELDPTAQGFLDDHRIDGTPVLPGVMGMESFAEAARVLAPDLHVVAVEDVDFLAPVKFYRDEPRVLEVHALLRPADDGDGLVADCALVGRRTLPGQPEQVTTHFTGRVLLAAEPRTPETAEAPADPADGAAVASAEDVYRIYFHGPAYQVLSGVWADGGRVVGELTDPLPADRDPVDAPLTTAPRLAELCFQTAGVRELGLDGVMALPLHVERMEVFPAVETELPVRAVAAGQEDGSVDAVVVGGDGEVLVRLLGYRTVALPGGPGADLLAPLAAAVVDAGAEGPAAEESGSEESGSDESGSDESGSEEEDS
ncbi:MAG: SDR family NAD(P)-dependent oxidoreductase [Candidatus Nanopelagicales bacterium]